MLRISWTDKVTNEDVFHKAKYVDRKLLNNIVSRQMQFFGHVVRKEDMQEPGYDSFIEGKRAHGRQGETYLTYMPKRKYLIPMELIHFAHEGDV